MALTVEVIMKVLAGMIVYSRTNTVSWWMRAWHNAEKYGDAKLLVVHNHDGDRPPSHQRVNIGQWKPDYYYARANRGQDIGALRDVIAARRYDPWDVLFWAVDDNVPMRKDFLRAFIKPFEDDPKIGLVGNYWVKGSFYPFYKVKVPDHFRTSCFAIRREAAMQLCFPSDLSTKWGCYTFEWLGGPMNMSNQIKSLGFEAVPVGGDWNKPWVDCNDYIWDVGCLHMRSLDPRCRKDCWQQYEAQFAREEEPAWSVS
jgi:hypothetical protein